MQDTDPYAWLQCLCYMDFRVGIKHGNWKGKELIASISVFFTALIWVTTDKFQSMMHCLSSECGMIIVLLVCKTWVCFFPVQGNLQQLQFSKIVQDRFQQHYNFQLSSSQNFHLKSNLGFHKELMGGFFIKHFALQMYLTSVSILEDPKFNQHSISTHPQTILPFVSSKSQDQELRMQSKTNSQSRN